MVNFKNNQKCSPSYTGGSSCFTDEALQYFIEAWNKKIDKKGNDENKIDPELPKETLLKIIREKFKKYCKTDDCMLDLDFLNELDIEKYRKIQDCFRPSHPVEWLKDKKAWLSTSDIDDVLEQYDNANKNFKYFGAVPIDFDTKLFKNTCVNDELCKLNLNSLYKKGITKLGVVFNLDPHDKPGSHWMSMFSDLNTGGIYYYDSYGIPPEKQVLDLMKRIQKQGNDMIKKGVLKYNDIDNQHSVKGNIDKIKGSKKLVIQSGGYIEKGNMLFIYQNQTEQQNLPYKIVKATQRTDGRTIIKLDKPICNELLKCQVGGSLTKSWIAEQKSFQCFYNNVRYQKKESECGTYGIYFIVEMLHGKKFQQLIHERITDDKMNDLRYSLYWRKPYGKIKTNI